MPVGRNRNIVLGPVRAEIGKAVDAVKGQELLCLRPFDRKFVHVVRLVEKHCAISPGGLFVPPVPELGCNDGIHIHPHPAVAQHLDGICVGLQGLTQAWHSNISLAFGLHSSIGHEGQSRNALGEFGLLCHDVLQAAPRQPRVFARQGLRPTSLAA